MASSSLLSSLTCFYHRQTTHRCTTRMSRTISVRCSQEEDDKRPFSFDFSSLQNVDIDTIRRTNLSARRRLLQNRGVAQIYPQVYGQATKIEKVWKDWKSAEKDSYSRGLEYLTPEFIDPEDEWIIANDGLFIEKKYPEYKTKSTIITKEGQLI